MTRIPRAYLALACLLAAQANAATPALRYEVVARYAHSGNAFTQGLELSGDTVYESSGLYRHSYIAAWPLATQSASFTQTSSKPTALKQALPNTVFAEGLTVWNERVYTLSWRENRGFIFDRKTLKKLGEFSYSHEGWGLTNNNEALIMSDGTDTLRFVDPDTFAIERTINVSENSKPVDNINELEWIPARAAQPPRLLANIWQSDEIVVIDTEQGRVTARLDLSRLYPKSTRSEKADVLNGIAFDKRDHTLLVTGKFWPYVYRIRVLDTLP